MYLRKAGVLVLALGSFHCLARAQNPTDWTDASGKDNNWSTAGNWTNGVPTSSSDVTVPAGPMAPNVDISPTIFTLTVSGGLVQLKDNRNLQIDGSSIELSNGGALFLDSTGTGNAMLTVGGPSLTVSGNGILTMSDQPNRNLISGGGTFTNSLTSDQGIQGAGTIGAVNFGMTIKNFGTINANAQNPLIIFCEKIINQGFLEANGGGGGLSLACDTENTGGLIQANGSTVRLPGLVHGGTISTSGGGVITLVGTSATLADVTNTGFYLTPPISSTTIQGTITNTGTINLQGDQTGIASLLANQSATLTGAGSVVMTNSDKNLIGSGSSGSTLRNQQTIQGSGTINVDTLVNQGTINANGSFGLILRPGPGGVNNTGGTLMSSSGATFTLDGGLVAGGTINNGATFNLINDVTLKNVNTTGAGDFQSLSCTFDTDTNTGTIDLGPGDQATYKGPWTNQGIFNQSSTTTSPSTVTVSGNVAMVGTGTISMLGPQNIWEGASGTEALTLNSTMQGSASLQSMNVVVGSHGLIQNSTTDPFTITMSPGNTFSVQGLLSVLAPSGQAPSLIKIKGGMFKNFNPTSNLNGATTGTLSGGKFFVAGTLQFDNASIVTNASNLTLSGQIIDQNNVNALQNFANNKGTFVLMNPGTFSSVFNTASPFTNTGKLTIQKGRTFAVGGSTPAFNQTLGTTTVDGVLNVSSTGSVNITGGTLAGNGTISGNVIAGNPSTTGGIFLVGDTSKKAGLVTVTNNYSQLATGAMDIQIGGTTAGTKYSQLNVTGPVSLGGTLNLARINNYLPPIGQTFMILTAPSGITGNFATVNGASINSTRHFSVSYTSTAVMVIVQSGP